MEEQKVLINQLRPGLFIRLNLKWGEHPFFFSSFKIKSDEQIRILRGLGLKEITYVPEKSDCQPLPFPYKATEPPPLILAPPVAKNEHLERLRKEKMERMREQRQRIHVCEKQYQETLTQVRKVIHNFTGGSKEAAKEADQLIQGLVDSIIADRNTILHVMNIKTIDETFFITPSM